MKQGEKIRIRRLQRLVDAETDMARDKYRRDISEHDPFRGMNVFYEEAGKVSRCFEKIELADDPDVVAEWRKELRHRIATTMSVMQRMYLAFGDE